MLPKKNNSLFNPVLAVILTIILTFPEFVYSYSWGIDPSLPFLFHYIRDEGLILSKDIVFPYGPLTFLMYPIYSNPLPAIFVRLIIHTGITVFLFVLAGNNNKERIFAFISAIILLNLNNFHGLLTIFIILSYLLALMKQRDIFAITGIIVSIFAVYIKINAAIMAGLLSFSFLAILVLRYREYRKAAIYMALIISGLVLLWFFLFRSFKGFISYFSGQLNLAAGNGTGASIYPDNSAFYLISFLIVIILLPLIIKKERSSNFFLLTFLALFAGWKHGFGRQDLQHNYAFLVLCLSLGMIFLTCYGLKPFYRQLLILLPAAFISLNLNYSFPWAQPVSLINGPGNLHSFITGFKDNLREAEEISMKNVLPDQIPDSLENIIGNSKIDIYPWDYGYLAANELNWQPRPSIQAFLSYTSWIEEKNIEHFQSEQAPEFLLWHYSKIRKDINISILDGIDNRYVPDMEPGLLLCLMENYEPVYFDQDLILYKNRKEPKQINRTINQPQKLEWGKWYSLDSKENVLTRIRPHIQLNLLGKLKSLLFKDFQYTIYIKNSRNDIYSRRIIPEKAESGILVNPFFIDPRNSINDRSCDSVMFIYNGRRGVKPDIEARIEYIESEDSGVIPGFFCKSEPVDPKLPVYEFLQPRSSDPFWNIPKEYEIPVNKEGEESWLLPPGKFSPTFSIPLDSLPGGEMEIRTSAEIFPEDRPDALLVVSLEKNNKTLIWDAAQAGEQYAGPGYLNIIRNSLILEKDTGKYDLLKVYIWNTGKDELVYKDLKIRIYNISPGEENGSDGNNQKD